MIVRLFTVAVLTAVGAVGAVGQDDATRPFAFISNLPTLTDPAKWKEAKANLTLRPNVEQTCYVYLHNPTEIAETVNVVLGVDPLTLNKNELPASSEVARTAQPVTVAPGQTVPVALVFKPASAAASPGKEPPGLKLKDLGTNKLVLRVDPVAKADPPAKPGPLDLAGLTIIPPKASQYVATASAENGRFQVTVTYRKDAKDKLFSTQPAKVTLDLRTDVNTDLAGDAVVEQLLEAELPTDADGQSVTLFAKLTDEVAKKIGSTPQSVAVGIDGYDRVYRFKVDFTQGQQLNEDTESIVGVRLSSVRQQPGAPVLITLEPNRVSEPVELFITSKEIKDPQTVRTFPTPRNEAVYVRSGEGHALILMPVVQDWTVEYPTAKANTRLTFSTNKPSQERKAELQLDRTAPGKPSGKLALRNLPAAKDLLVKTEHTFQAEVEDPESDVTSVYFYTGDTPPGPDGKPAANSKLIKAVRKTDKQAKKEVVFYEAEAPIELPATPGKFPFGVWAINGVGLSNSVGTVLKVIEPEKPVVKEKEKEKEKEKPKPTKGSLRVQVLQSTRPQPGLPVALVDASGKAIKTLTTDAAGVALFKDLPPGEYTVQSVKKQDQNASGTATATVEASDDPTKAEIKIKR